MGIRSDCRQDQLVFLGRFLDFWHFDSFLGYGDFGFINAERSEARYITLDAEDKDDMLNDVCDLIDENGLANIRELRRFVKTRGAEHNLPSMKIINSVLRSHTGLIRLYFDAVYQERKYGRSDFDKETGELK